MRAQPLSGAGLGSDGMRPRAIEAANKVILRNHRCCFCENVIVAGRLSPAREPHASPTTGLTACRACAMLAALEPDGERNA